MLHARALYLSFALASLVAPSASAVDPGKAAGTVTIGGVTTALTVAVESTAENLFDDKKKDTIITLTDKPLGDTEGNDDSPRDLPLVAGAEVAVTQRRNHGGDDPEGGHLELARVGRDDGLEGLHHIHRRPSRCSSTASPIRTTAVIATTAPV